VPSWQNQGGIIMKYQIDLGVVCFARKTFDYRAAGELYQRILDDLRFLPG
jgi:hypothetical protein